MFFGCNVLGADVQIDGLSYGTCPAQLALTPGVHNLLVSYPPYYYEFKRRAVFNQEGQTYKIVLQITKEGEKERRSGALFDKQLALADAMLGRYKQSGATDDYVRKMIAEGTAVYWKNSFGRIAITDGFADNIQFATPVTKTGDVSVPPKPDEIAQGLKALLMSGMGK